MKYKYIKQVLRHHIKTRTNTLWTWEKNNFTCIYQNYPKDVRIYTPEQLLETIEKVVKGAPVEPASEKLSV